MSRDYQPCAMCSRFTIAGHAQQAAAGMGRCTGFDKFVAHDAPPCVLFLRERDRTQQAARERFVARQQKEMAEA
jgi:hypothetical protein